MTDEFDRISLTLPREMVSRLDAIVDEWEYDSRSKAIRDALRDFFVTYEWDRESDGRHYGTIVVTHDHHAEGIADRLQRVQHEFADAIISVQHIHLSHDRCMETLAVDGDTADLTELSNRLRSMRGVRQVKVVVVDE
ncbi:CopG family transcriptional regulator, nickel-responsive regulator [Halogranum amylolyticum]|uniref:Putative nickel-responsive regulator n=1 Tax=Halogranum amylolyticum TaxID=660520 RepID=A0A1H8W392_9EURY|nr:nickel-responsive transcriptional regulator NikR [Halogranum amylolyticum]SEP21937.1 CopG family transcriptional regulator, nickel-responsive regulator [Halogranum amylolyticum]